MGIVWGDSAKVPSQQQPNTNLHLCSNAPIEVCTHAFTLIKKNSQKKQNWVCIDMMINLPAP